MLGYKRLKLSRTIDTMYLTDIYGQVHIDEDVMLMMSMYQRTEEISHLIWRKAHTCLDWLTLDDKV